MQNFLNKVVLQFPALKPQCDVVAAEPDEHNRWCLLYNNIILLQFVHGKLDEEELEPLIIAWFRLVSSTEYCRRSAHLHDLPPPKDHSKPRPPSPPSRSDADSPRATAWLAEFEWP